jgi:AAA family ATP:ADP antiporter
MSSRALVARGEAPALWAAAGAYFCLLSGYYMLRSLREAMALEAGREYIPVLFTIAFAMQLAILPLYWWIVARTARGRLLATLYLPIIAVFLTVASSLTLHAGERWLAGTFFVLVTAVNLFMVSVFWSVMADRWSPDAAKRLFGFIAGGGSAGALAGPLLNTLIAPRFGPGTIIVVACALLAGAVLLGYLTQSLRAGEGADSRTSLDVAVGGRAIDDLLRLARSPFLLVIAGLIVAGQTLGAFMYNEQARVVEAAYTTLADRTVLFARLDFAVSALSLVCQTLIVGWLTTRGSLRLSLSAMPVVIGLSFVALALAPTLMVLLVTQVVRRAADYGLSKPTREMLFTVLNPESKFKSKSLIDTVLQRGADTFGNWLYFFAIAGLGLSGVAWVCAIACFALIGATWWLGTNFERQRT